MQISRIYVLISQEEALIYRLSEYISDWQVKIADKYSDVELIDMYPNGI